MAEPPPPKKESGGVPAWVMTFADIMALLMCFFVLLLSFSEMDALKYKQIAGSMAFAFGVQNEIEVKDIPKGTSFIKQEFSAGKPKPTPINVVRQQTTRNLRKQLSQALDKDNAGDADGNKQSGQLSEKQLAELIKQAQVDASDLKEALKEEIELGEVEIETSQQRVIVRVREQASFPSGTATLKTSASGIMERIGQVLVQTPGKIIVAGHTDDIPIKTARFRSNWELSAGRAVSVAHELLRTEGLPKSRFLIEGHADSDPLAANDSRANRAKNRRVEIVIVKGFDIDGGEIRGDEEEPAATTSEKEKAEFKDVRNN